MTLNPALRAVQVTCPHCARPFEEPAAWLATNHQFRCVKCDRRLSLSAADLDALKAGARVIAPRPQATGQPG